MRPGARRVSLAPTVGSPTGRWWLGACSVAPEGLGPRQIPGHDSAARHSSSSLALLRRSHSMPHAIDITGPITADGKRVLTPEALRFVGDLEAWFGPVRASLLERRRQRDAEIAAGASYGLHPDTEAV